MRVIGMDIHRTFAEAVMIDGDRLMRLGRINMSRDHLAAFAAKLTSEDHIVIEATGNAHAVAEAVAPFVGRVIIANPRQVHLIAKARIKTASSMRPCLPAYTSVVSCLRSGYRIKGR